MTKSQVVSVADVEIEARKNLVGRCLSGVLTEAARVVAVLVDEDVAEATAFGDQQAVAERLPGGSVD